MSEQFVPLRGNKNQPKHKHTHTKLNSCEDKREKKSFLSRMPACRSLLLFQRMMYVHPTGWKNRLPGSDARAVSRHSVAPQQPLLEPYIPPLPTTLPFNFLWGTLKTQLVQGQSITWWILCWRAKRDLNYLKIEVKTKASLSCGLSSTQPLFHAERELSNSPKTH